MHSLVHARARTHNINTVTQNTVKYECINHGGQGAMVTKFCAMSSKIDRSSEWTVLSVTLMGNSI